MKNIYFVIGASGSGKSSIMHDLQNKLGKHITVYDFDAIGVPSNPDKKWRQESTEIWLRQLREQDKDACLLGQMVLGEILACPSAINIEPINLLLLDVSDIERIKRLKNRNTHGVDQHMLNWAAWLRLHQYDPQWMQSVIKEDAWKGLNFSRWDTLQNWAGLANIEIIDNTKLSIAETAQAVAEWITSLTPKKNCSDSNN
jgi:gluconate kinase